MNSYTNETYGEHVADTYDDWYADYDRDAITVLADLAGQGRALELGIGTGRIALPLSAKQIEVHGLDAAPSMIAKLRAKPGGELIPVNLGNFADVAVSGRFAVVYVVFNTFFNLTSQAEQVRCFQNVAAHLEPGGCFLIEAFVPELSRFDRGQSNRVVKVTTDSVELDMSQHHAADQRVVSQKVIITDGNVRLFPIQIRYAWPAELDLMAQLAGLRLRHRWSDWQRTPFTSESQKHVSVYELGKI